MQDFKVGDIVIRKSYGGDVYFTIADIIVNTSGEQVYVLKGLSYRLEADSDGSDLVIRPPSEAHLNMQRTILRSKRLLPKKKRF